MTEWMFEHWEEVIALVTSLVAIATIIAKWTPSKEDDKIVDKIKKLLNKIPKKKAGK